MTPEEGTMSVAKGAAERHEAASKLVEKMEAEGCLFNPSEAGWSISGPRGVYGKHDAELTDYAGEITQVLRERAEYVNKLYVYPQPKKMH